MSTFENIINSEAYWVIPRLVEEPVPKVIIPLLKDDPLVQELEIISRQISAVKK